MNPMKSFMVNHLQMAIERGQLILSPFDEVLHKQLVDYEVKKSVPMVSLFLLM